MGRGWIGALCAFVMVGCADEADPARSLMPGAATAGPGGDAGDDDSPPDDDEPSSDGDDAPAPDDDDFPPGDDDDDDDVPPPGGDDDDDDVPPPGGDDDDDDDDDDRPPSEPAATVFLDFDGATLVSGAGDDARIDQTLIPDLEGTWDPVDPGLAQTVLARVEAELAPFSIHVTDERPDDGDYTMVVVSQSPPPFFGAAGLSASDCGDLNPNSVAVVFGSAAEAGDEAVTSAVLFQLGVTYGLNATESPGDAMYGQLGENPVSFTEECSPLSGTPVCEPESDACRASSQSSYEELLARFGPA